MNFLAFAFTLLLSVAAAPAALGADVPNIPYEKYQLPNGLDVILVEDHRLPLVAVNIWYHAGAINEAPGLTGFAHLFEHMMGTGTKHQPRGLADQLADAAGATESNASTSFDRTNYYDTWPSNELALALWIHSDRMGYLLDTLDQAALTNQQDVVRNERRQRTENQPYGMVEEGLFHNLVPKSHPYHSVVIGSHADIQAARLEDIKNFFKLYYRPNNASLVLAGDIDKAKARALVAHYFGSLKRGAEVPPTRVETPPIAGERRVVIEDRIELPRVYMGWITPPAYQPGDAELDVVAQILGGGKSSRLYKKLVYEMQIAQDVEVSQYSLQLGSVFTVQVTARPGHDAKELEAAIDAELEKLRREGPDAKELERARNTIESALITGVEKLGGLADRMNRYNQYLGDPGYLGKDLERYRILTLEAVRKIAEEQLRKDARVVVYGVPGKQDLGPEVPTPSAPQVAPGTGTEALNAAEEWRRTRPKSGQLAPFKLPVPKSFALANGLKVIVHQRPGLPIVAANLVLKSGSEANPLDKPGLASFTADMLDEGTRSRSATQLAEDIAQLGTTLGTGSNADSSHVEFVVLKKNFAAALDIMADVTLNPAFAPQEIERQRSSRLALLAQVRADPVALVRRATASALYGTKHPFGYLNIGTEGALQATSRDDLRGFWQRHYVPDNAALVVAGDIDADELKALAQQAFGSWQPGRRAAAATPQPRTTSARLVLVDKADAPQSALRIARLGPPRSTPDYAAIAVMNAALGGLFTSRLNNTLREDKGYTYGAASGFRFHRSTGEFEIRTSVRTDVTAPAVGDALKVLEGMHRPMGREEWMRARDSQLRSLPGEFETSASTVNTFAELFSYDLGLDYYRKLPSRLAAVTPNSIQAAARRYLQAQRLVVVVVGDRKKIEDGLRKLNLGAIEYRDADANVVE